MRYLLILLFSCFISVETYSNDEARADGGGEDIESTNDEIPRDTEPSQLKQQERKPSSVGGGGGEIDPPTDNLGNGEISEDSQDAGSPQLGPLSVGGGGEEIDPPTDNPGNGEISENDQDAKPSRLEP